MNYKLHSSVQLIASTPLNNDHSVGYHDIKPFNKSNQNLIALHRYPLNNSAYQNENVDIEICLWDFINSKIEKIDVTDTWSWEQGSRLQWISENELIYNKRVDGKLVSCVHDINAKTKKVIQNSVYSVNKNKQFLHINYSRLWKLWKSYGYYMPTDTTEYIKQPEDDGIFICDLNNKKELLLSIKNAVKLCELENITKHFFLWGPTFNPEGNKFVSLLRFFNDTGALISYFIVTNIKDGKSQVLARERVTHFEWINNEKLVVWCRNLNSNLQKLRSNNFIEKKIISNIKKILNLTTLSLRAKILSTHYHVVDLKMPNKLVKLGGSLLTEDGHPQVSPNGKYLITDTYANKNGYQKLLLYDLLKNQIYTLGEFKLSDNLINNKVKYDLHPRWSNCGNLLSIDSSHEGSRQSYILDIEKLIDKNS